MTNAFYFGSLDEQLFAIYHEPALARERPTGVVMCYPLGQEYILCHRSYSKLAVQLSRAGLHVLRFDYYGTGDSSGNGESVSLEGWIGNTLAAIDELADCADIQEVCLVGLRMGATLAALSAAREASHNIKSVVLWEPVIDGKAYVQELLAHHRDWLSTLLVRPRRNDTESTGSEVIGFPLPDRLRSEIEHIDLLSSKRIQVSRALLIGNPDLDGLTELHTCLRNSGVASDLRTTITPKVWLKQTGIDLTLVPSDTLRSIAAWIEKTSS